VILNDLAKFSVTWSIARPLCDSWASCHYWPTVRSNSSTDARCALVGHYIRSLAQACGYIGLREVCRSFRFRSAAGPQMHADGNCFFVPVVAVQYLIAYFECK